ncbi:NYN domain-containing protein [Gordonia phosphorivorans]|uniref:NYN domain-containing protein n=1 Tax=Gordonia phosphorivorans TaxID=1056982 RepID=A0ABV6H564_9ACTN
MNATISIPSYRDVCAQRRLVLVDIENAARGATTSPDHVQTLRAEISHTLHLGAWDQIIVGCSHYSLLSAKLGWPTARFVVRSGPDGADLALLAELAQIDTSRFAELALVSGDHLFAPAVAAAGIPTTVLSHRTSLSRELRLAANRIRLLSTNHPAAA